MLTRQEYVKQHIETMENIPVIHCNECNQELVVTYENGRYEAAPCCPPEEIADQLNDAKYNANEALNKADIQFPYIVKQMADMMETLGDTALQSMIDDVEYELGFIREYLVDAATVGD